MENRFSALGLLLALVLPAAIVAGPAAAAVKPDERVRKALDAASIRYEVSDTGNFRVLYDDLKKGRTQLVIINSGTEKYHGLEVREIWSLGYETEGMVPVEVANTLLRASEQSKLGGWTV